MILSGWLSRLGVVASGANRRRRGSSPAAAVEQLEERTLLSVSSIFDAETGELAVVFSENESQITIGVDSATGEVLVDGDSVAVSATAVASIVVNSDPLLPIGNLDIGRMVGGSRIDLSGVTRADFPNLQAVRIDAGRGDDTVIGSQFADSIDGGWGDDLINGRSGDDTLQGGHGSDRLFGGAGRDRIEGGLGEDLLRGNAGIDLLDGGTEGDRLFGGPSRDALLGGEGDDTIRGGPGNDLIDGGDGWDLIVESSDKNFTLTDGQLDGQGRDQLAGIENAELRGGRRANRIDASAFTGQTTLRGLGGNDTLWGGHGGDRLIAGGGDDSLIGYDGNDTLDGGRGNDWLAGYLGDDRLNGRSGGDTLLGGDGNDVLFGGAGHDVALGQNGRDRVFGQGGRFDTIAGGSGDDRVVGSRREIKEQFIMNVSAHLPEWTFTDRIGAENESPEVAAYRDRLVEILLEDAVEGWQDLFEQPVPWFSLQTHFDVGGGGGGGNFRVTLASEGAGATPGFSDTNTQEEGVDEADIVKTDGEFLYIAGDSWGAQQLTIVDAWPGKDIHVVSQVDLDGRPVAQYLAGDRLTVVTQKNAGWTWIDSPRQDSNYRYNQPSLTLTTIDLTDRSTPLVTRQLVIDGRYVDSRARDGYANLVVQNNLPYLKRPRFLCYEEVTIQDEITRTEKVELPRCFYESEDQYRRSMRDDLESNVHVPRVFRVGGAGDEPVEEIGPLGDAASLEDALNFRKSPLLTTVVSFDLDGTASEPTDALSLAGDRSTTVYASQEGLYLVTPPAWQWIDWLPTARHDGMTERPYSAIAKLAFSEGQLEMAATGSVPGRVHDRFSLDEHDGMLRVATTTGGGRNTENHVFVLAHDLDQLNIVGRLEGLAPGEQVYSARFMDDRAFLVTFRLVDPLFAIDLSDPTAPQLAGELKITGFSDYLQPIDDTHLLGIGRNADAATGRFQELQISLFDVSDLTNPTVVDTYSFAGGRSGDSEARFEPHAVSWFPESQTLAIPLEGSGWRRFGNAGTDSLFEGEVRSGLQVFHVDLETGFERLGQVTFQSRVRRSVQIGESLYAISDHGIKVTAIDEPGTVIAEIAEIEYRDRDNPGPRPIPLPRPILFRPLVQTAMPLARSAPIDIAFADVAAWIDSV